MAETDAERLDKVYKYVFGNGEIGLDERMRNLEKTMTQLTKALYFVGGSVIAWVIVRAIEIFTQHL